MLIDWHIIIVKIFKKDSVHRNLLSIIMIEFTGAYASILLSEMLINKSCVFRTIFLIIITIIITITMIIIIRFVYFSSNQNV